MADPISIVLVLVSALLGSFGPIYFKQAAIGLKWRVSFSFILDVLGNRNLYLGVLFPLVGTALFVPALRGGDVSVLYPLIATQYVWASFWSVKWLGERMNWVKWLGIFFVIAGVALINLA